MKLPFVRDGSGDAWSEYAKDLEIVVKAERDAHAQTLRILRNYSQKLREYQDNDLSDLEKLHGSDR